MKHVDEYRDATATATLAKAIARTVTRPWTIMEVCGGQTHAIVKYALDELLPGAVTLVHGPGCPVCVTPVELIDRAVALAGRPDVILCSFGDMLRVPGTRHDLLAAKAAGGDVRVVYSPLDAVRLAADNPARHVVFFAVGFETTAPTTAMAAFRARRLGLTNFSLLSSHVLVPPAIEAILSAPGNRVQGFLAAGHVCTVMGYEEYVPVAVRYRVPIVVTGFEPVDILRGVLACLRQLEDGRAEVENEYSRSVVREGNRPAQEMIRGVFSVVAGGGGDSERSRRAGSASAMSTPRSTRSGGSRSLPFLPTSRPNVSRGWYSRGRRSHTSVRRSAPAVPRSARSAPRWSPRKGRAPRTTATAGSSPPRRGEHVNTVNPAVVCPVPLGDYAHVLLAHGGGGRLTKRLIDEVFHPAFRNPLLDCQHDGAVLPVSPHRLALTTDAFVVRPLFFPGGDIGTLAVNGTVNDLAMCGARPLYLSASFVIEEGLPFETLRRVVASMKRAADTAGVRVVTGDTKVVDRGKGDGLYLSTSGVGAIEHDLPIGPASVRSGDAVILSGDIGRHGMAVMAVREGLAFETPIESDCAPVADPVLALLAAGVEVRCLRDPTRGGLAAVLVEIAETAGVRVHVEEPAIPVDEPVRGACEVLGIDPLYVACEGRFVAFVPAGQADRAVAVLRDHPVSSGACRIGEVEAGTDGLVTMTSSVGTRRVIDLQTGELLPRIC